MNAHSLLVMDVGRTAGRIAIWAAAVSSVDIRSRFCTGRWSAIRAIALPRMDLGACRYSADATAGHIHRTATRAAYATLVAAPAIGRG